MIMRYQSGYFTILMRGGKMIAEKIKSLRQQDSLTQAELCLLYTSTVLAQLCQGGKLNTGTGASQAPARAI